MLDQKTLAVDNLIVHGSTIESRDADGDIYFTPHGTGKLVTTALSAQKILVLPIHNC